MLLRRLPAPTLRRFVSGIVGFDAAGADPGEVQVEAASLDVPVIVTFAGGFRIALDRAPGPRDALASFAAGLHPGFITMAPEGAASCLQVNFTPVGARLALGIPMQDLASRMVPLDDLGDRGLVRLADRLAATPRWEVRLALAEHWAAARVAAGLARQGDAARVAAHAYTLLARSGGRVRVGALAERLGWSRKRLAAGFREEFGLSPKPLARILRFRRACRLAADGSPDWADIAAGCGYADQAHLTREFRSLAGATPAQIFKTLAPLGR